MKNKFRAWDNKLKMMAQVLAIDWAESGEIISLHLKYKNGTIKKVYPEKDYGDDIELMQYIGIKDKNKKEICEGDILESWYSRYPEYNKDFEGDLLTIKYDYGEYVLHYLLDWCGISNNIEDLQNITNYEIIGNIYENAELLKSK